MINTVAKFLTALILLTFSTFVYGHEFALKGDNNSNSLSYTISIDKADPKKAQIEVTFTPKDSILYMSLGAQQLPKRWATFIHNIKAKNEAGRTIKLVELPDAQWKLHSPLDQKILLSYTIKLDHENYKWSGGIDGVAYSRDWGVFYTGRSLFILNGEQWENIAVKFHLSEDWHITTPWQMETKNSFTASNLTELNQSMFFAGTHQEFTVERDDFELVFALGGKNIIAQQEEYKKLAEGVFDYYIDLMGGLPNPSPDNKFKKVVVIVNPAAATDGEVIGNNISILIEKDGDEMSKVISKFLFAHEFFHLWNGKSFFPESDDTEWFKEGFTNYYTLKSLYHIGFLNDQSYLGFLNNLFYQRYINDKGVGTISMAQGEEKHDHWGIIYGGGLFVGIAQDMMIRNNTDNNKNIDDLMKKLYKKYGGTNNGYTLNELQQIMTDLNGKNQSTFFDNYITGAKEIPIYEYLNLLGFNAKVENKQLIISKKEKVTPLQQSMIDGFYGKIDN